MIYKCSCNFCFVKTDLFRYSSFVSCVYFKHRKGLAGRKPVASLRQWLVNPFGAACLSLTDREISRSQIYWQLSQSETGNLQPKLYRVHPPTGTEVLAQNLQTRVCFQSGLRVYICNFVTLCSLLRKQSLSPYNFCECITQCFTRKGWGRQVNWHSTAHQATCCFQSENRQSSVFS